MAGQLRIVFFGTYDERTHPRVLVLREGLIAQGHRVEVVNQAMAFDTAARVRLASQPWRAPFFVLRLMAAWLRLLVRSAKARRPDVVVVGYLGAFDVHLARLRWRRARLVLDQMVSLGGTIRDRQVDRSSIVVKALAFVDRAATRRADTVLVDTPEQIDSVDPAHRHKVVVVPVGAPQAWFDAAPPLPETDESDGPLRVVFLGLYTPLQGAPTIGEAIGRLADREVTWTMIGAGQDRAATEAAAASNARITWVDWVDAAELPGLVADHDVCLGIFGTSPKARNVVPNKVYQGAAAGCAVITSETGPQRAALGDAALYVPPGDCDELARVIDRLAADRTELARLRRAARTSAEQRFLPASVISTLSEALVHTQDGPMSKPPRRFPPLPPNAALRWDLVTKRLDQVQPESVLELGAGQGAVAARLAARTRYVGVEPDETSRSTSVARVGDRGRVIADLADLDPAERFGLVCAFEVLEHIPDDKGALATWVERVEPGGHVLVSVPADPDRFGPFDELVGHLRRYTSDDLAGLFESAGLEVVSVVHYGFGLGDVLEAGRDVIGKRRLARAAAPSDAATRTAGSGRNLQPPAWAGPAIWWATTPFRLFQRRFPTRGPGLVGLARRPD